MLYPIEIECPELIFSKPGIVKVEGDSGVGKSSFFRSLVGLERATIGQMVIAGEKVTTNFERIRNLFLYLPQAPMTDSKVVLEYFVEVAKFNPHFNVSNFELLSALGLELLDKPINTLSGGENQLVKLEIMLALNPKIIVLDEAFTGIDEKKLAIIKEALKTWFQGKLVFNISHSANILDEHTTMKAIFEKKHGKVKVNGQQL